MFINECLPAIKKSQGTRQIVIISSILARLGVPGYTAYCASKAGLLGLMRSLAVEYASQGIMVNAVCPGFTDTPLLKASIENIASKTGKSSDEARKIISTSNPMGRLIKPEEVAETVLWLIGDSADSVSGQAIAVCGGETA